MFFCPKKYKNSYDIFEERYLWYKHAKASYDKWGAPIYIQLAFIKKESDFNWLAKPPRKKIFKIVPFKRPSSSFGYSQAVKGTWEQYKRETNNPLATRARFKDLVDFIGWYINKTNKLLKYQKKTHTVSILHITKDGEIIRIILRIKKQLYTQKRLKIYRPATENN